MNQPNMPPPPPPPPPPPAGKSGFPSWLKYTLIGCGGLIVLVIIAVVGLGWWVARNGDRIKASAASVVAEGEKAGAGTDQNGCIEKAKAYGGGGLRAAFNVNAYLEGCMRTARETPGFCASVPRPTELRRAIAYQNEQCRGSTNATCQSVIQAKMQYCFQGAPGRRTPSAGEAAVPPPPGDVDLTPPVNIDSVRAEVESKTGG